MPTDTTTPNTTPNTNPGPTPPPVPPATTPDTSKDTAQRRNRLEIAAASVGLAAGIAYGLTKEKRWWETALWGLIGAVLARFILAVAMEIQASRKKMPKTTANPSNPPVVSNYDTEDGYCSYCHRTD